MLYKNNKSGDIYEVIDQAAQLKDPTSRRWLEAIVYIPHITSSPHFRVYCREATDFHKEFTLVNIDTQKESDS